MEGCEAGERIALAAMTCLGTPFRAQGRSLAGLDCVGVVVFSLQSVGFEVECPTDYRLGRHQRFDVTQSVLKAGFSQLDSISDTTEGDIVVKFPSFGQVHFAVCVRQGIVEANISLGKVVFRPSRNNDGWESAWRWDRRHPLSAIKRVHDV